MVLVAINIGCGFLQSGEVVGAICQLITVCIVADIQFMAELVADVSTPVSQLQIPSSAAGLQRMSALLSCRQS